MPRCPYLHRARTHPLLDPRDLRLRVTITLARDLRLGSRFKDRVRSEFRVECRPRAYPVSLTRALTSTFVVKDLLCGIHHTSSLRLPLLHLLLRGIVSAIGSKGLFLFLLGLLRCLLLG